MHARTARVHGVQASLADAICGDCTPGDRACRDVRTTFTLVTGKPAQCERALPPPRLVQRAYGDGSARG